MTPSEFRRYLEVLREKGVNSCAYLASYNGETAVLLLGLHCKFPYPSTFKSKVCNRRDSPSTREPVDKELAEERQLVGRFLFEHYDYLVFEVLETSEKMRFPLWKVRNLFESIKPTLQPVHIDRAGQRMTTRNGTPEGRIYRNGWKETNLLKARKYREEHYERVRSYEKKYELKRKANRHKK